MTTRHPKISLRASARRLRAQVPPEVRARAEAGLQEIFSRHIQPKPGDIVAGYAATGSEIDCFPLLSALYEAGVSCALPVVGDSASVLQFYRWRPGSPMTEAAYGIMEPKDKGEPLTPAILLVPLLAYDAAGHRLGYGGGYYDRTIAHLRAGKGPGAVLVIGIAFAAQRVDNLPYERHDQRLDAVVTESGFYEFA